MYAQIVGTENAFGCTTGKTVIVVNVDDRLTVIRAVVYAGVARASFDAVGDDVSGE